MNNFDLVKNGYDPIAVDAYKAQVQQTVLDFKMNLADLTAQNAALQKKIEEYNKKTETITKAIYNAVQKAEEIDKLSQIKYAEEIEYLNAFHDRWLAYYQKLLQKYPLDDSLQAVNEFNKKMSDVLKRTQSVPNDIEQNYVAETERVKKASGKKKTAKKEVNTDNETVFTTETEKAEKKFSPMQKIQNYFDGDKPQKQVNDNFDYKAAQNPTDDLKTIMRDLGFLLEE